MKELQKFQILPSMSSPSRSSLRIRKPLWNYLEDFIARMIPRIFGMLSRFAVEIHLSPVNKDHSLNILLLKDC